MFYLNKRCRFCSKFLHLDHHLPFSLCVRRRSEMAPKKKKQSNSNKPNSNSTSSSRAKPQPSSSSSSSGPRLQISAENESRLRRLLINNSARSAPAPVDDTLSRAQKAKKLKAVYENLSCEGFTNDQIELALSALKVTLPIHSSLCLVTEKIQ